MVTVIQQKHEFRNRSAILRDLIISTKVSEGASPKEKPDFIYLVHIKIGYKKGSNLVILAKSI